jgi:hypothetical protein
MPPTGKSIQREPPGVVRNVTTECQAGNHLSVLLGTDSIAGIDHPRENPGWAVHPRKQLSQLGKPFDNRSIMNGPGGLFDKPRTGVIQEAGDPGIPTSPQIQQRQFSN